MSNNIQTEIDELKATIAKLEEKQKAQSEPMFKRVELEGHYHTLRDDFTVETHFETGSEYYDTARHKVANYFTDETVVDRCSTFMQDRFWFIHKSIEFADGYEFVRGGENHTVEWSNLEGGWVVARYDRGLINPSTIYTNERQGHKFIEWLNKHKPEGL